ncbi:MAG: enoyl-CoA hydratase/isomerase family protein [Candidatus Nanopelagicales bacterium]
MSNETVASLELDHELLEAGNIDVESQTDSIVVARLARPDAKNAQTPATWRALAHVASAIGESSTVRAVILAGSGQSFSAGLDRRMFGEGIEGEIPLAAMSSMDLEEFHSVIGEYQQAFVRWRNLPQVVVAAVQGYAIGAGFQLALGADIIVVGDDVKFSMKETQLGLIPDLGGTKPLVDAVGYQAALEMCLTGRWIEAEEAVASGIALKSVPTDQLADEVNALTATLISSMPGAQFETKALLAGYAAKGDSDQHSREREAQNRRIRELAALISG